MSVTFDFDGGAMPLPLTVGFAPKYDLGTVCLLIPRLLASTIDLLPARWFITLGGQRSFPAVEKKSRRGFSDVSGVPFSVRVESRIWSMVFLRIPRSLFFLWGK